MKRDKFYDYWINEFIKKPGICTVKYSESQLLFCVHYKTFDKNTCYPNGRQVSPFFLKKSNAIRWAKKRGLKIDEN